MSNGHAAGFFIYAVPQTYQPVQAFLIHYISNNTI